MLPTPPSAYIRAEQVAAGMDVADHVILARIQPGDLVITADIPLAAQVVSRQAWALNPRGEWYTEQNVGSLLSVRNFMQDLRDAGQQTGGPPALHARDVQRFASALDHWLAKPSFLLKGH